MENVLPTAYNRAYLATAIAFAQIPLRGTSDMLRTLGKILISFEVDLLKRIWRYKNAMQ